MDEAAFLADFDSAFQTPEELVDAPKKPQKKRSKTSQNTPVDVNTYKLAHEPQKRPQTTSPLRPPTNSTDSPFSDAKGPMSKIYKSIVKPLDLPESIPTEPETIEIPKEYPGWLHTLYTVFEAINIIYTFTVNKRETTNEAGLAFEVTQTGIQPLLETKSCPEPLTLPLLTLLIHIATPDLLSATVQDGNVYIYLEGSRVIKRKRIPDEDSMFPGKRNVEKSWNAHLLSNAQEANLQAQIQRRSQLFAYRLIQAYETLAALHESDDEIRRALLMASTIHHVSVGLEPTQQAPIQVDSTRPNSLLDLIPEIKSQSWYQDQIVTNGLHTFPERSAAMVPFPDWISQDIATALLQAYGVTQLYSHQFKALQQLHCGNNVVVSTQTASGKSLIYQVPVLTGLERSLQPSTQEPSSSSPWKHPCGKPWKAVFIFPTKALAQDQLRSVRHLLFAHPLLQDEMTRNPWFVSTFDGDTPQRDRNDIVENAHVILTNPDMIHFSMLSSPSWRSFWSQCGIIVIDEVHCYSSIFGSHVSMVFRRLHRLLRLLNNDFCRFVACSATIDNPGEHLVTLLALESPPESIMEDGSPRGPKHHLIWQPPLLDPLEPARGRRSGLAETSVLVRHLMKRNVKTVVFCKYRKVVELLLKQMAQDFNLLKAQPEMRLLAEKVVGYRAGYVADDRRRIEQRLFTGQVLTVIATTALELGVDIGYLDCVIHLNFPFNMSSYLQQSGRAGRRLQDSMSILISDGMDPMGGYYARRPQELFFGKPPPLPLDPLNPNILEGHLQCAASEDPIDVDRDWWWFSPVEFEQEDDVQTLLDGIVRPGTPPDERQFATVDWRMDYLRKRCKRWLSPTQNNLYLPRGSYLPRPAMLVPIRDADEDDYKVFNLETGKVIETLEHSRAIFELYEGSVFLHQGKSYLVHSLDLIKREARLAPSNVLYVTEPRDFSDVDVVQTRLRQQLSKRKISSSFDAFHGKHVEGDWCFYGKVKLTTRVFGYYKVDPHTRKILETVDNMEMPPYVKDTWGCWFDVDSDVKHILDSLKISMDFAIHGVAHVLLSLLPRKVSFGMGMDVRTECKHPSQTRIRPARVVLYDTQSNGSGLCLKVFKEMSELLKLAAAIVENCPCESEDGCIECIQLSSCKEHNMALNKEGTRWILRGYLGL